MAGPACPEPQGQLPGEVLGLSTEELGDVRSAASREVCQKGIDLLLGSRHIVAVRMIDDDVDRHGLAHVLSRDERGRNESVRRELELPTHAPTVLVIDLQAAVTSRARVLGTVIDGTSAVERLCDGIHREDLRFCEQDDSVDCVGCPQPFLGLGGY